MGDRIAKAWESFERDVLPADAGDVQRREMRRAFYAGAWEMTCIIRGLGEADVSEDLGVEVLQGCYEEGLAFKRDVIEGRV